MNMLNFLKKAFHSKVPEGRQASETCLSGVFDEVNNREQKLIDQLSSSPIVEITGLVNIRGVGAAKDGKEILWTMTLKFDVWRIGNEGMEKDLTVRRVVTPKELKKFKRKIKAESIIKIRGRVLKENVYNSPQALMEEYVKSGIDDIVIW